jgi:phosphatidylglycerophosphatase A
MWTLRRMLKLFAQWISSGFGSGYSPIAPGTFGSIAAFILWWVLCSLGALPHPSGTLFLAAITTVVGTIAVTACISSSPEASDPQWIVIDEWAGLFIALAGLTPSNWQAALVALGVFRIFDASKLGPVGWAEQLPGAYGIMADDLVAGALTAGVILLCRNVGVL